MEIRWPIKNQNAKYKFDENPSKESSINISKEIFDFLGGKQTGDIITVKLRKEDFLFAFTKLIECLPLFYYRNGTQKADFSSDFFETICCVFNLQKRGFSCKISKINLISSITKMQKGDTTWKV